MRKIIFLICIFATTLSFSQKLCFTDIMNGEKLYDENKLEDYQKYDFSELFVNSENTLGIIGDNYQRLRMKILTVIKNEKIPNEYLVYGKSNVSNNICDFMGIITIEKIQVSDRAFFGIDNSLEGESSSQGLITAKYDFFENKIQKHSGIFSGKLQTKWYLNKNEEVKYDDMFSHSDSYFNNSFVGIWKMYNSNSEKICHWANERVPNVKCEFDIGAGEFSPNTQYSNFGWSDFSDSYRKETEWWK